MNIVELDVGNLRKWLFGTIGSTGTQVEHSSQNGYILYFSDRRGMLPNASGIKTGEYGFEDNINPDDPAGTPNVRLDSAEDVNENGTLEKYGADLYGAPTRNYSFDTDFQDPAKMPPGTPHFQDINNLGYRQDYTPQ